MISCCFFVSFFNVHRLSILNAQQRVAPYRRQAAAGERRGSIYAPQTAYSSPNAFCHVSVTIFLTFTFSPMWISVT